MVPQGHFVVCPHCRVFADALSTELPSAIELRCPWCFVVSTAERWAEVADQSACPDCSHPLALHVAWYTADGEPPSPHERQIAHAVDAPCTFCQCRTPGGGKVVVA